MTFRKRGFRAMVLGLLATAGLALAPAAFAGGHVGIGINLPGVSVGYANCYNCGFRGGSRGFVDVGFGGGYYGGYAPYYGGYYAPYPAYDVVYGGPVVRAGYYPGHYYHGGYYYRDRGYYRRGYR